MQDTKIQSKREAINAHALEVIPTLDNRYSTDEKFNILLAEIYKALFFLGDQVDQIKSALSKVQVVENIIAHNAVEIPEANSTNEVEVLYGVEGLADYLKCGRNKAQAIINSKILVEKGIQYKVGGWRFKRAELDMLLQNNPLIFDKIRCKR